MSAKREKIEEKQLQGFKYYQMISPLLQRLHGAGCARDRAGNRDLYMDQYMSLILLYLFNPICSSLRAVQQASELPKVQRKLGVPRASLGSLSEAARVFDSALMEEIIHDLIGQLPARPEDPALRDLPGILTAADGTLIPALSSMFWAVWKKEQNAVKAHTQFDIHRYVPIRITLTDGNGNEKQVLENHLEAGRIYVLDRGFAHYQLLQKIVTTGSFFVCRIRDNAVYEVLEEHPLSAEAHTAGIVFDRIVNLGSNSELREQWGAPMRVVAIRCTPHKKRYKIGRGGPEQGEMLLIATNLLEFGPDVIALIFQKRWTIETFFNFFKHLLGCRHLLSHNRNGIELQMYAAIIACLLMALWTGRKPTLRTYEMLCWYFTGMADEDDMLRHIARLQKQDAC